MDKNKIFNSSNTGLVVVILGSLWLSGGFQEIKKAFTTNDPISINTPVPSPTNTPEISPCPSNLREATYALKRALRNYQVAMRSPLDYTYEPANTLHSRKVEAIEILRDPRCVDEEGRWELRESVDQVTDYLEEARVKIIEGLTDSHHKLSE